MQHEPEIVKTHIHEVAQSTRLLTAPLGLWSRHVPYFVAKWIFSTGRTSTAYALRECGYMQGSSFLPGTILKSTNDRVGSTAKEQFYLLHCLLPQAFLKSCLTDQSQESDLEVTL